MSPQRDRVPARSLRRDTVKEGLWRERLKDRERSGLTVREFCGRIGVRESMYYWWKREIGKRDAEKTRQDSPENFSRRDAEKASRNSPEERGEESHRAEVCTQRAETCRRPSACNHRAGGNSASARRPLFAELRLAAPGSEPVEETPSVVVEESVSQENARRKAWAASESLASGLDRPSETACVTIVLANGRLLRVGRPLDPALVLEVAALLEGEAHSC
jgi:hypothetical protein